MILNLTPNRHKIYHSKFTQEQLLSRLNEIFLHTKSANYLSVMTTTEDLYKGTIEGNKFKIKQVYFPNAPTIYGEIFPEEPGSKIIVKIKSNYIVQLFYYLSLFIPIAILVFLYFKIPILIFSPLIVFPLLTFIPFVINRISIFFLFTHNNFFLERWLVEDNINQRKS
ncbi:MAG: hypothetical protein ACXWDO_12910, partial [Bacteroidia bacterium]